MERELKTLIIQRQDLLSPQYRELEDEPFKINYTDTKFSFGEFSTADIVAYRQDPFIGVSEGNE